jgi:alpha-beta hydrolase superfamily lysophospholipase
MPRVTAVCGSPMSLTRARGKPVAEARAGLPTLAGPMQALHTADGQPLHLRQWAAPGLARGTVLLCHGLGEHIGRYAHVAEHLNRTGWHVAGFDHRGHGASGGPRGVIPRPDSLLDDLGRVVDAVREWKSGPLVLLGHSMGGAVAARYVAEASQAQPARWYRELTGLVLSSPALALRMNWAQHGLLALLGSALPRLPLGNGLKPQWVSHDPAVVKAYSADPLVHDRVCPGLVRFMLDAGEAVRQAAPRWQVPTLLLYAGADRCVDPSGSDEFAAAVPVAMLRHQRYDGLAHEIFNEPEKARVLGDLDSWLRRL